MNQIYQSMKKLIPSRTCLKYRDNDEFLIVSSKNGEIFYLNGSAKLIYQLFDGHKTIENVLFDLKNKYEARNEEDIEVLQHDLIEIIRDFQWQNVIQLMEVQQ